MMPSPSINPLLGAHFSILPPSSSHSSSLTSSISLNSNRLITTNAIPIRIPVNATATLTEFPHAPTNTLRRQFNMIGNVKVDDNLALRYDSRSNPCLRPGFLVSDNSQFGEEIPGEIRGRIEKDFTTVPFQKRLNNNYKRMIERREYVQQDEPFSSGVLTSSAGKSIASRLYTHSTRRRSFWVKMKMAIDETASAWEKMVLMTWVISSVKLLLSLTLWKSMFKLINMLLLVLLMPFTGSRRHCVVLALERVDEEEKQKGIEIAKEDNQGVVTSGEGPAMKTPKAKPLAHPVDLDVLVRREIAIQRVREDKDDIDKTSRDFKLFVTPRGATLFTQSWTPVSGTIKGLVVLLHGLNEHSGRYSCFAKQLNANGYMVYGLDWIGHGGSDGLHGYVHSLDDAVSDVKAFLNEVWNQNPETPCFCFGHSTGGAILLKAALDPKIEAKIDGLILTSPAIGVQASHPIYTILAPIISILLPRYQCGAANKKGAVVSRDPEALLTKYSDPLVYTGSLRVRTGYEILQTSAYLQQNLRRLRVPFMVLHGTADVITDPKASEKLHAEASSTDKTIKLYQGLLHDLLFEPERETIVHDIVEWLTERT